MSKAEDMKRSLQPLAESGNIYASIAWLRLAAAEDPEAEAERIIEEWQRTFAGLQRLAEQIWPALIDIMGPN